MKYSVKTDSPDKLATDCLVLVSHLKSKLGSDANTVDAASNKALSSILRSGDFSGKLGETLLVHGLSGIKAKRVLLAGGGEPGKLDARHFRKLVQCAMKALVKTRAVNVHFSLTGIKIKDREPDWAAARIAQETESAIYRYQVTKSRKQDNVHLKSVSVSPPKTGGKKSYTQALALGSAIGEGVNIARELGNLPGNICTPSYLADQGRQLARKYSRIKTQVLSEKQMENLGMGALLSVSAGSAQEAKLIVMEYRGNDKSGSRPVVLVGKGITFDTGGISIKPGQAMDEMKFDMCGAASVIGALDAVAALELPVNVVAIIAAAENMPGSRATKPGDIVTSMSGKTIEVLNTDAEGRLVLCDALTYASRFKPRTVIDIATLTGAAVGTFGEHTSALLSNDDKFAQELLANGRQSLDLAWQLPMWDDYQSQLDSNFADIANIGGPRGGTITAACFLSRFTEKYRWAHLDIAGSAWLSGKEKGATGRPVPLLVEYLRQQKP
ncbi:MAG: leucyl aminopeptidase [Pseudohongiellaceae bacterium]